MTIKFVTCQKLRVSYYASDHCLYCQSILRCEARENLRSFQFGGVSMAIKHSSRKKGKVQTLRYTNPTTGKEVEIGVFDQGEYTFTLDRVQTIRILDGSMVINNALHNAGEELTFAAGTTVIIKCRLPCSYICFYARRTS